MNKTYSAILEMVNAGATMGDITSALRMAPQTISARMFELRKMGYDIPHFREGTRPVWADEGYDFSVATEKMVKACRAHLDDLIAVYGPAPEAKVEPEGMLVRYHSYRADESYCGSPSAMIAELG
jgi:hypothetical protein